MQSPLRSLIILSLLLVATLVQSSYARKTGAISGTIRDFETGSTIEGAVVTLVEISRSATTDANGRFTLTDIPVGSYTISVSHANFAPVTGLAVEVVAGRTVELSYDLKPGEKLSKMPSPVMQAPAVPKSEQQGASKSAPSEANSGSATAPQSRPKPSKSGLTAEQKERAASLLQSRRDESNYEPQLNGDYYEYEQPYNYGTPDDMYFRDYGTQGWVPTRRDRLSTFAADVDDASFALVRQYLVDGNLPPTEAVRLEEFVNHFDYGYRKPETGTFRIFSELAPSPFDQRITYLKVGIKGKELTRRERRPINLTVVLDISGSMNYDNRFQLVKQSLDLLLQGLNGRDRVGIVTYGPSARVLLDPVSGDRRDLVMRKVNKLYPNGSTYAEAGLKLGYKMANRQFRDGDQNVVILLSDGVANVGKTSPEAIMSDIRNFVQKGITLSTFGFGMGNYNDVLLERLAVEGNGRYAYINDIDQAQKEFVDNVTGTTQLLARNVKIQVDFSPQVVEAYRLIGYENRAIADNKFRDNRQDGAEVGSGHEVTALYELQLKPRRGAESLGSVAVRWIDPDQTVVQEVGQELALNTRVKRFDAARPEFRLAVIGSQFGELLKQTRFSYEMSYSDLLPFAQTVAREMRDEQTRELVDLIERASSLSGYDEYHTDYNYER